MRALFLLLVLLPLGLSAQNYEVEKYPEVINSEFEEVQPLLTPDGNYLYFVRIDHPENHYGASNSQDIWFSHKDSEGNWSKAQRVDAPFNDAKSKAFVWISPDGKRFILTGQYTKKGKWKKRGLSEVLYVDGNWTDPIQVKIKGFPKKNKGSRCNVHISSDEKTMLLTYTTKWDKIENQLYVSQYKKNAWGKPKRIKSNLKKFKTIDAPYYSPTDSTIFFAGRSKEFHCLKQEDIFSIKILDEKFKKMGEPEKMEGLVNTLQYDSYYSETTDGPLLLASSRSGNGDADLYYLSPILEDQFLYLSGRLTNTRTGKNLSHVDGLEIKVNGEAFGEAEIKSDGTYSMTLPLGEKYELVPVMDGYTAEPVTVDVSSDKEFVQKQQDLGLTPPPFVMVSGFIINQKTGEKIGKDLVPTVLLNDLAADSIAYDPEKGYSMKLNWGSKYKLAGQATDHESVDHTVDLSDVSEYKEITQDLLVIPQEKFVTLKGTVVNGKTNRPMPSTVDYSILVDGTEPTRYELDKSTAEYELYLKPGKKYEINAASENYVPNYLQLDLTSDQAKDSRENLTLTPIEIGQRVVVDNIFFETASAKLTDESFVSLDHVVELLNKYDYIKIEIGGHTDSQGSDAYNQKLSEDRAKSVNDYIVSKSISESRVSFKGYGESDPVATNKTPGGRSKNRRVEFKIVE